MMSAIDGAVATNWSIGLPLPAMSPVGSLTWINSSKLRTGARKLRWQPDFVPRHSAAGQTLFYFEQERGWTTRVTLRCRLCNIAVLRGYLFQKTPIFAPDRRWHGRCKTLTRKARVLISAVA